MVEGIKPFGNPFVMTEERLDRMQHQLYFKIEQVINEQVPSKRARLAADIDAITSLAVAIGNAPLMHTLQAAAEIGFMQAGHVLPTGSLIPTTPPGPTENN